MLTLHYNLYRYRFCITQQVQTTISPLTNHYVNKVPINYSSPISSYVLKRVGGSSGVASHTGYRKRVINIPKISHIWCSSGGGGVARRPLLHMSLEFQLRRLFAAHQHCHLFLLIIKVEVEVTVGSKNFQCNFQNGVRFRNQLELNHNLIF